MTHVPLLLYKTNPAKTCILHNMNYMEYSHITCRTNTYINFLKWRRFIVAYCFC